VNWTAGDIMAADIPGAGDNFREINQAPPGDLNLANLGAPERTGDRIADSAKDLPRVEAGFVKWMPNPVMAENARKHFAPGGPESFEAAQLHLQRSIG
jgi:hypothetical protein